MKQIVKLLTFILLVLNTPVSAQYIPLLQNNAKWNEYYFFESNYNYTYRVVGDSIFYGKIYKKILYECPSKPNSDQIYLLREDLIEKKVYEADYFGNETLRYNFNINVGDTIFEGSTPNVLISISDSIPEYCNPYDTASCWLSSPIVYHFFSPYSSHEYWIQGIGSLAGLRRSLANWCSDTKLICHFDSIQTWDYYHHFINQVSPCDLPVSTIELEKKKEINVYPNPSDNDLIIEGDNIEKIKIIDHFGVCVKEHNINGMIQYRINLELSSNVYYLEIQLSNGSSLIKKIIKI